MKPDSINITQIIKKTTLKHYSDDFAIFWIKNEVEGIEIDHVLYANISNSIFFLDPKYQWKILKKDSSTSSGYVLYIASEVLNNPIFNNLDINKLRIFNSGEITLFKLNPGIEKRTQIILEMIDEFLGSNLKHKDDVVLSLLFTFFVYCDGQCNIKSTVSNNNSKTNVVYVFKSLVDKYIYEHHKVADYANLLNLSPEYLNECVKEVLSVSSKSIIIEQLLIRSRHALKFSNKTIKEISFELGFSSPDYFSYFFKTHTGITPSSLRKS